MMAIKMIAMVTEATKHAHSRNIVHRDLKPSNIMLKRPNECRVIDFGLGVYVEQYLTSRLTKAGESPAGGSYTARELIMDASLIDPRSDIYSIGAVWYTAVTNQIPAGANLFDSLRDVGELPSSHKDIILKCLSDVQLRFTSCDDLFAAIENASNEVTQ